MEDKMKDMFDIFSEIINKDTQSVKIKDFVTKITFLDHSLK